MSLLTRKSKEEVMVDARAMFLELTDIYLNKRVITDQEFDSLMRHYAEVIKRLGGVSAQLEVFSKPERIRK